MCNNDMKIRKFSTCYTKKAIRCAVTLLALNGFLSSADVAEPGSETETATDTTQIANQNGQELLCDGLPYVDRGVAMVPARQVCDFLGAKIVFADNLLTIVKSFGEPNQSRMVSVRIGGKSAQISDGSSSRNVALPRLAELRLGTIFLPAKFLVEILGGELEVNKQFVPQAIRENQRRAIFTSSNAAPYRGQDAARITVINRIGRALSLRLTGPQSLRLEIGHNEKVSLQAKPGVYYYKAGSSGLQPAQGARRFFAGRQTTWVWGKQ